MNDWVRRNVTRSILMFCLWLCRKSMHKTTSKEHTHTHYMMECWMWSACSEPAEYKCQTKIWIEWSMEDVLYDRRINKTFLHIRCLGCAAASLDFFSVKNPTKADDKFVWRRWDFVWCCVYLGKKSNSSNLVCINADLGYSTAGLCAEEISRRLQISIWMRVRFSARNFKHRRIAWNIEEG